MPTPYKIQIPPTGGEQAVRAFLDQWVSSPAFSLLASEVGVSLGGSFDDRLAALRELVEPWDFRSGRERLDIEHGATKLPVGEDVILEAARAMALAQDLAPAAGDYDHCLVLGGTALASYLRVKYAGLVAS